MQLAYNVINAKRNLQHFKKKKKKLTDLIRLLPGYEFTFQPAMLFHEQGQGPEHLAHEGIAIFSKFPIIESEFVKLR